MGGFYGNITLKGANQRDVAQALRGSRALVAPETGGFTVVFNSACDEQNIEAIQAISSRLSREFHCAFASLVHDDDVLVYFLYENGALTDSYNSCPSYFDGSVQRSASPADGDAGKLCATFGADCKPEVENVLRKPRGKKGYVFETRRHEDLVRLLGLPNFAVGTALASFERGDYPNGLSADRMLWAKDAPSEKEDRRQRLDREFYNKLGPEDPSRQCKQVGCNRGAIRFSVLCKRHHFEMIEHRDCPYND